MLPMIIGLSGYGRAGKDSVADVLVERHRFQRVAFADKLRECAEALNPIVDVEFDADESKIPVRYLDAKERHGYNAAKEIYPEFRGTLQRLGTEVGRNILGGDIWVDATMNALDVERDYVITDCRFPNEAQAINRAGGLVVRVQRPGNGPANEHPSETALDDYQFDGVINNDGTLEDLATRVEDFLWLINFLKQPVV